MEKQTEAKRGDEMEDSFFGQAIVDIDEWRDEPVRHRYVHGGFEDTDTRFSFYFPPKEQYEGRLLQTLEGGWGGSENTAIGPLGFGGLDLALAAGAYLVESNQGHFAGTEFSGLRGDPSVLGWRASAQSARFSKELAAEMYGSAPHHSYVFGGSGGGIRSILCLENGGEVWDGAVPFMFPHQMTLELFSNQLNVIRLLGEKMAGVADAVDVGGSGDPFAGLNTEQRHALAALYRSGFPHGAWLEDPLEAHFVWTSLDAPKLTEADPGFFEDFWSVPGYAGADRAAEEMGVFEHEVAVRRVVTAGEVASTAQADLQPEDPSTSRAALVAMMAPPARAIGVVVDGDGIDAEGLTGATITVKTGSAAGREVYCPGMAGDVLVGDSTGQLFEDVAPGDVLSISNRKYIAFCHYDRHQVEDFPEQRQHRVDGRTIYPQRPRFNIAESLHGRYKYQFKGKMIAIMNTLDRGAWPCGGARYHDRLRATLGDAIDENFRLWWTDNATHMPASMQPPAMSARSVDYTGLVHQAILDVIDWVENGSSPPATTGYDYNGDSNVTLATAAEERRGIQPVVTATVNGAVRADVKVGEPVQFDATAKVPPAAGNIISAEWDFDGTGTWPVRVDGIDGSSANLNLSAKHSFDAPGTYFPAVRVTSHRAGDPDAPMGRIPNLGRVRVVVR